MSFVVVDEVTGCWLWKMPRAPKERYGYVWDKERKVSLAAHVWSWEIHNGPIIARQQVLHRCDRKPCVNPAHLFLGTQSDNIKDAYAKGRIPRGEARTDAKIDNETVAVIKSRKAAGERVTAIARAVGVSHSLVSLILSGKRRAHG